MKITIQYDSTNTAFIDNQAEAQLICEHAISNIFLVGKTDGLLKDSNGNTVGKFKTED